MHSENVQKKVIADFFSRKLEIECVNIELRQCKEEEPTIFEGPGSLYQDDKGKLQFKLYHKFRNYIKEQTHGIESAQQTLPGKIIDKEQYFSFVAEDMSGNIWEANNILVQDGFSFPAAGKVIKSPLKHILHTEERRNTKKNNYHVKVIFLGKFSIPCNETEKTENSVKLNTLVFMHGDVSFKLRTLNDRLEVNFSSPDEQILSKIKKGFIEAFSILTGALVRPAIESHNSNLNSVFKINSVDMLKNEISLFSPVDFRQDVDSFTLFVGRYLDYYLGVGSDYSPIYGYWIKVNRAYQGGLDNFALALSVSIEGIVKDFFNKHGKPDKNFIENAAKAAEVIANIEIEENVKSRILHNLSSAKGATVKNSLFNMSGEQYFPKSLVDNWLGVRNKSAHPKTADVNDLDFQTYLDELHSCLSLFYRLIFIAINYTGKYINHADNFNSDNFNIPIKIKKDDN